jgi:hypothetical protein
MAEPLRAGSAGRALLAAHRLAAERLAAPEPCHCDDLLKLWSAGWWLNAGLALSCVALAALAAGLTMGLVAIEPFRMQILVRLAARVTVGRRSRSWDAGGQRGNGISSKAKLTARLRCAPHVVR